jgi:hypothetical protein
VRPRTRLSDRDVERLDEVARALGVRSVVQEVEDWEALVESVARGYWGTVADYEREMRVRARLERALAFLEGSLQERLARRIQDADVRFVEATRDGDELAGLAESDGSWWWRRVPLKLGRLSNELR